MNWTPKPPPDEVPSDFPRSLVDAMRQVVDAKRDRTLAGMREAVDAEAGHLEVVRSARESALRERAETEVAGIGAWERAEMERTQAEALRKVQARSRQLDEELAGLTAATNAEQAALAARADAFEREMTAFIEGLDGIDDPTEFAPAARRMPSPWATSTSPSTPSAAPQPATMAAPQPATIAAPQPQQYQAAEPEAVEAEDEWKLTEPEAVEAEDEWELTEPPTEAVETAAGWPPAQPDIEPAAEPATEPEPAEPTVATATASKPTEVEPAEPESELESEAESEPAPATATPAAPTPMAAHNGDSAIGDVTASDATAGESTFIQVRGLSSFGAITAFKQSLEKVDGIKNVTLGLGPNGEFVYTATHASTTDLDAVIRTIAVGAEIARDGDTLRVKVARKGG